MRMCFLGATESNDESFSKAETKGMHRTNCFCSLKLYKFLWFW